MFIAKSPVEEGKREMVKKGPGRPAGALAAKAACWSGLPGEKRHGPAGGRYEGLEAGE